MDSINWAIQLFEYEHLSYKLKECGKFLWIRLLNPCLDL